ncbi:FAD/NAD(P)-binding domain-containing protein [Mollisia scopiformis]|uniref:FAD/NAD(P)-binding domain-containing protein n=1 Tax=Mollisia scopiformis TaxID=149040 RepID=A0A194WYF9_MOLSC|nr:FAD/NAD(P)-binding domain-containing protein [Mollisia scopiformis]KUJ12998.1 FAD/NAD(P)-binding domain-containing protein [Mollisia scopiformis]
MAKSCIIIGGGIAGITAALSLSQIGISCTIYELRATPATIGGAVNLTPNALRLLESLDVELYGCRVDSIEIFSLHTGKKLGELPFRKFGPALRILREELLRALLRALSRKGVVVSYGYKLVAMKDESFEKEVTAVFENGEEIKADFVLGCDGVHSAVRSKYVDPERLPIYTNVAVAYTVVEDYGTKPHFHHTSMNSGRFGSLLTSYVDPDRTKVYLGAVMEVREQNDRQGWKVRGSDRQKTLDEIKRRYRNTAILCVNQLVQRADDFVFYPVYTLRAGGRWSRGRVLLLGDAAHCMPPQGESTRLAIEDGILFARVFETCVEVSVEEALQVYEKTRRPRIDAAYKEAVSRWESVKDKSWLMQKIIEWLMWVILWYKMSHFETSISYDVRKEVLRS